MNTDTKSPTTLEAVDEADAVDGSGETSHGAIFQLGNACEVIKSVLIPIIQATLVPRLSAPVCRLGAVDFNYHRSACEAN